MDLMQGVDSSIGFDIEVKMATPPNLAVTPGQEVERLVAPILATVQAVAAHSSRPIIFTSFDPDICRCTSALQYVLPIANDSYQTRGSAHVTSFLGQALGKTDLATASKDKAGSRALD